MEVSNRSCWRYKSSRHKWTPKKKVPADANMWALLFFYGLHHTTERWYSLNTALKADFDLRPKYFKNHVLFVKALLNTFATCRFKPVTCLLSNSVGLVAEPR